MELNEIERLVDEYAAWRVDRTRTALLSAIDRALHERDDDIEQKRQQILAMAKIGIQQEEQIAVLEKALQECKASAALAQVGEKG